MDFFIIPIRLRFVEIIIIIVIIFRYCTKPHS